MQCAEEGLQNAYWMVACLFMARKSGPGWLKGLGWCCFHMPITAVAKDSLRLELCLSLTQQRKQNKFTFSCTLGVERPWDPKHFVLGRSLESRAFDLQVRNTVCWTVLVKAVHTEVCSACTCPGLTCCSSTLDFMDCLCVPYHKSSSGVLTFATVVML